MFDAQMNKVSNGSRFKIAVETRLTKKCELDSCSKKTLIHLRHKLFCFCHFLVLLFYSNFVFSASAGTDVSSIATVFYDVNGVPTLVESSPNGNIQAGIGNGIATRFVVDQTLSSTVTSNRGDVSVLGNAINTLVGESSVVAAFEVTNTGNETHDYLLTALNSSFVIAGTQDQNILNPIRVFVESDRLDPAPSYSAVDDTDVFIDDLGAGEAVTGYVLVDIPASAVENDFYAVSLVTQVAQSNYSDDPADLSTVFVSDTDGQVAAAGVFSNGGVDTTALIPASPTAELDFACNPTENFSQPCIAQAVFVEGPVIPATENLNSNGAIDEAANGQASDTVAFIALPAPVNINKTQQVTSAIVSGISAGAAHSGATVQYQLAVNVTCRTQLLSDVIISDSIPLFSTYQSGSLRVGSTGSLLVPSNSDFTTTGGAGFDVVSNRVVVNLGAIPAQASCTSSSQSVTIPSFPAVPAGQFLIIFDVLIN